MTDSSVDRPQTTLTVDPHDTLPEILERLRSMSGTIVRLEIPDHSPIFLTATEFRTLRETVDRADVALDLATEDGLRLQLASMFGLADRAPRPSRADDATPLPSSPSFRGWRKAREDRSTATTAATGTAEPGDPIAESRKRRSKLYDPGRENGAARAEPQASLPVGEGALDYLDKDGSRGISAKAAGRIVAVVAVLLLVLGASGWYFLPTVEVRATLRETPVETGLLYSVTAPGAEVPGDADFSVEATEESDTVEFTISVPATGIDREPQETARGEVVLRNASAEAVVVPAGTTLTTRAGIAFTTDAEVEVPAGSDDGSTIGEVTVAVTAAEAGGSGNLEIGVLSGRIEDGPIYFSNREAATSGGSDIEVAVVSEDDIANLETQIESDLRRVVAEGWSRQLGDGRAVVGPSVEASDPEYEIENEAGDVSETATLRGTVEATGFVYDLAAVEAEARESFAAALSTEVPEGYALDPSTIVLGEPQLLSESPQTVEYELTATGRARAVFDENAQDQLGADLAGTSWSETVRTLSGVPAFASWEIERSPGWWPQRVPQSPDRVSVVIDDGPDEPTATPAAS